MKPTVSIIIPLYNRKDLVKETLDSVIAQTYPEWEALVIDDGSTDDSQKVAESYAIRDSRVRLLQRNREPKGANTCRNIGIKHAEGNFIIFLDSDDLLAPFCLERRIEIFQKNKEKDFLVFPSLFFKNKPYDTSLYVNINTQELPIYRFLRLDTVWLITQPMWKKDALFLINGFDERLKCWQDLDIDLKAFAKKLKYVYVDMAQPDSFIRSGNVDRITNAKMILEYLSSMKKVVKYALLFLEDENYNKNQILHGIRVLTTQILINLLKVKEYSEAYQMLIFANCYGLYTKKQRWKLIIAVKLHQLGLDRLRGFLRIRNMFLGDLSKKNRLWAKVKFNDSANISDNQRFRKKLSSSI